MWYIGIDVHKSFSQVAVLDANTGDLQDFRIASDRESLYGVMKDYRQDSRVALEASCHWAWVADQLQGMELEVVLSHPKKTKAIGGAKIKTDKIDARMLARLLAADMLPEAHISSPQARELKSYLRYRYGLVCVRTQAKNRIHSILAGYGLRPPCQDLFTDKGLTWLECQELAPLHGEQVRGHLHLIKELFGLIAEIDKRIKPMAEQNEQARIVKSVWGIGYYSALLIVAEMDGVERFPSAKHVTSYFGLCPSTRSSGGKEHHGHITRSGSPFLRWILVEAAQRAGYRDSPFREFYWSIAKRKGPGVAKVAVARKMLESIYQMLKTGKEFDASKWKKPRAG